jgi:hypothetical protein
MTAAYLFYAPQFRPLSPAGAIMPNCYLQFYLTGTTTPTDIYADAGLTTPLANPLEANAAGEFVEIYLDPLITYRVQLFTEDDVLVRDTDPLAPPRDYPPGTIVWFYGDATARDAAYPPDLWQVLDGTNGTPDARDRFPIFAGGTYAAGDMGGAAGATSAAGAHDHGGAVSAEVLTLAQTPLHGHRLLDRGAGSGIADATGLTSVQSIGGIRNVAGGAYVEDNSLGTPFVEPAGSGDPHTHDIAAELDHDHTVTLTPPFIALWAMMRRA